MSESIQRPPGSEVDLRKALGVQWRVVGALMMRELHTRFGRNNIGYLWLIIEPLILSLGISVVHLFTHTELPYGFKPGPFYASGYIVYITFRNTVNRASGIIEGNKTLMYHRQVTLLDIVIARSALDAVATLGALIVVLGLFALVGLGDLPARPHYLVLSQMLMTFFAFSVSLIICGASEFSPAVERFVHPATYLMMPISGMVFILDTLPPNVAHAMSWFPSPQITDLARMGMNASYDSSYINYGYLITVISLLSFIGLAMLRVARRHMHFE